MKHLIMTAAAVATTFFIGATTRSVAQAVAQGVGVQRATIAVPVGNQIVCNIIGRGSVTLSGVEEGPSTLNASASGSGTFQSVATTQVPVTKTELTPVTLNLNGTDPVYGTYSFQLDNARPAANTTVTANQAGADFPATVEVFANVIGTISGLAGTFINSTPCHMTNGNLQSFNPQVNETYTFVNDVVFVERDAPDGTGATFTIPAGSTITLN